MSLNAGQSAGVLLLGERLAFATSVRKQLEERGHAVHVVSDPREAECLIARALVDVAVVSLNLSMPAGNPAQYRPAVSASFTGWAWLQERAFRIYGFPPDKVILHSHFAEDFLARVPVHERMGVRLIRKGPDSDGTQLVELVHRLAWMVARQTRPGSYAAVAFDDAGRPLTHGGAVSGTCWDG